MSDYEDGNAAQADDRQQREWETKQCLRRVRAAGVAEDDIRDLCQEAGLHVYHQTDPRGCALYISREPLPDNNYTRGCAVY
jgi:hypothetical protein